MGSWSNAARGLKIRMYGVLLIKFKFNTVSQQTDLLCCEIHMDT